MVIPKLNHVLMIGAGKSGLASSLALHAPGISSTPSMDVQGTPSTIWDAINFTPNALHCLDHLGVFQHLEGKGSIAQSIKIYIFSAFSGQPIAELSYRDTEKIQYHACRIPHGELLQAIRGVVDQAGVKVKYGKKLASVTEHEESVTATFEDWSTAQGDIMPAYTHVPA